MTTTSNAMAETTQVDEIPTSYKELYTKYGGFVAAQLRKHNKVGRNFEELQAHVWKRLVEKDILKLFRESVANKMPRQMTGLQACEYLGISWKQWKTKMWSYHVGVPIFSRHDPKLIIGRRARGWMPTPIDAAEYEAECHEINRRLMSQGFEPTIVSNGCQRKTALFDTEDIKKLASMNCFKVKCTTPQAPEMKPTKAHFQAYLSKSIFSDFSNWCRTYARKWSQDQPMYIRDGADERESNWEAHLVDPSGTHQETSAVLKEAVLRISETLHESMKGADPLKCKPVAQTEIQMFTLLEQGVPLGETLRKLDIPERVRRNILKSVADFRSRAA